jgi:hypothetical protein
MTSLATIAALGIVWEVGSAAATAQQPESKQVTPADGWANKLLAERFVAVHKLIMPQPGESRWREVPWQTSLWEARQMAAAAGKPMFVWCGSGGAPCAPT